MYTFKDYFIFYLELGTKVTAKCKVREQSDYSLIKKNSLCELLCRLLPFSSSYKSPPHAHTTACHVWKAREERRNIKKEDNVEPSYPFAGNAERTVIYW